MIKSIKGFEGKYAISDSGVVYGLKRNNIRKQRLDKDGYPTVVLVSRPTFKYCLVHKLVWETFVGDIPEGMQVNHINEIKTDNRLGNLNLMTPKENVNWGTGRERQQRHIKKPVVMCDKEGNELFCFLSATDAHKETGIRISSISSCCKGRYNTAGGYKWKMR